MNDTMIRFGHPATLIRAYAHWVVLLRPRQVTLGSLVLVCSEPAQAFSAASRDAFDELAGVTGDIEKTLAAELSYDKINYLMLMMVDPHVHFHVLPRYARPPAFAGVRFPDAGWPGPPDLQRAPSLTEEVREALLARLQRAWPISSSR